MTVFADSSAVVKRYVAEAPNDPLPVEAPVVISVLAWAEVLAAFARKAREGAIDAATHADLRDDFFADVRGTTTSEPVFESTELSRAVIERAGELVLRHPLRTLDLLQLASAMEARDADGSIQELLTFDARLADAARLEGFRVPPLRRS